MTTVVLAPHLPRGRHGLTRDEVEQAQRLRLAVGMAEAMRTTGYARTPVAAVLKHARVSRETFYALYDGKLDCFLAAIDLVSEVLLVELAAAVDAPGSPLQRLDRALAAYLDALTREPGFARLILVEVYAAGPEAMARRAALQERLVDRMAELLQVADDGGRFALEALVAAVSTMVTGPIVDDDPERLRALHGPVMDHVRTLVRSGLV